MVRCRLSPTSGVHVCCRTQRTLALPLASPRLGRSNPAQETLFILLEVFLGAFAGFPPYVLGALPEKVDWPPPFFIGVGVGGYKVEGAETGKVIVGSPAPHRVGRFQYSSEGY